MLSPLTRTLGLLLGSSAADVLFGNGRCSTTLSCCCRGGAGLDKEDHIGRTCPPIIITIINYMVLVCRRKISLLRHLEDFLLYTRYTVPAGVSPGRMSM